MLLSYAEVMSEQSGDERKQWGPKPRRKAEVRRETKLRLNPELMGRLEVVAKIEERRNALQGQPGVVSLNQQISFVLQEWLNEYEKSFGVVPSKADKTAIERYARAAEQK